jgi:hypothetical protein
LQKLQQLSIARTCPGLESMAQASGECAWVHRHGYHTKIHAFGEDR